MIHKFRFLKSQSPLSFTPFKCKKKVLKIQSIASIFIERKGIGERFLRVFRKSEAVTDKKFLFLQPLIFSLGD